MGSPERREVEEVQVCDALLSARGGVVIDITYESSSCLGVSRYLVFPQQQTEEGVRGLQNFLVNGEKLYCSNAAFYRNLALASQPPVGLAPHVIFSPMEKAELEPQVVLFICNPEQGSGL